MSEFVALEEVLQDAENDGRLVDPTSEVPPLNDTDVVDDDDEQEDDADQVQGYRGNPKFQTFRKHARDLYQHLFTLETVWPCETAQLLPYARKLGDPSTPLVEQTIVTGTSTHDAEQNYVKFVTLTQPQQQAAQLAGMEYDEDLRDIGAFGMAPATTKMRVDLLMAHEGNVRKVRYVPHNPNVIITSSSNDSVYVFDRSTIARTQAPNKPPRPQLILLPPKPEHGASVEVKKKWYARRAELGNLLAEQKTWDDKRHPPQHKLRLATTIVNGWGLDISTVRAGWVCLGGDNGVELWSIGELKKGCGTEVAPCMHIGDISQVNDVKWHVRDANIIGAACGSLDSKASVRLIDVRQQGTTGTIPTACGDLANSLDWSHFCDTTLYVGGADGTVSLFDTRRGDAAIAIVQCHSRGSEVSVSSCPHDERYVATGGSDGNTSLVCIASGPVSSSSNSSGVMFVHTGHQDAVKDLCWSPQPELAGQVVSCDSNALCAWKPRNRFWF